MTKFNPSLPVDNKFGEGSPKISSKIGNQEWSSTQVLNLRTYGVFSLL